jgi:hypothetical protein
MIRGLPRFPVSVLVAKAASLHAVSRRRLAAFMLFLEEGWQPSCCFSKKAGSLDAVSR